MKRLIKCNIGISILLLMIGCGDGGGSDGGGGGGDSSDGGGGGGGSESGAFEVSTISPTDAAIDINTSTNIVVTFNKAVDDTTLANNFTVSAAGTNMAGSISVNSDKTQATFDPTVNLSASPKYTVTLSSAIKSSAAISLTSKTTTFTTVSVDTTAPTVTAKNAAGTTLATSGSSISTTEDLKLVFSKAMDADTVNSTSVTFSCNGVSVTPTLTAATDSDTISNNEWTVDFGTLPQNNCTLVLGTELKDANGVAMASTSYAFSSNCGPNDLFGDSATFSSCWIENDTGGWLTADIQTTNPGKMTLAHSSTDSTASNFPAVWKRVTGNFAVAAYVDSTTANASVEVAALSAVDATSPASRYLDLWFGRNTVTHPTQNVLYYGVSGSNDTNNNQLGGSVPGIYLCLIRNGSTVAGSFSTDGTTFTAITGASVTLTTTATDIHIGSLSTGNGFTFAVDFIKFSEGSTTCPTAN